MKLPRLSIKSWFRKWLGVDDMQLKLDAAIAENGKLNTKLVQIVAENVMMLTLLRNQSNRVSDLADIFYAGADISATRHERSWAVVCINGKTEQIQFMDLSGKNAREVHRFLSAFNRENIIIDAPPGWMFKE